MKGNIIRVKQQMNLEVPDHRSLKIAGRRGRMVKKANDFGPSQRMLYSDH